MLEETFNTLIAKVPVFIETQTELLKLSQYFEDHNDPTRADIYRGLSDDMNSFLMRLALMGMADDPNPEHQ